MSTAMYDDAIRSLRDNGIAILGTKSATEDDLNQIEARLGVTLPVSYKKMLSEHGALEIDTIEIYGWLSRASTRNSSPMLCLPRNESAPMVGSARR